MLTFSNFGSFLLIFAPFADFLKWLVIFPTVEDLQAPEVIPTSWLYLRGFGHSYPRGMPRRYTFFRGRFSTILPISTSEHPGISFCGSQSITSPMRHERYLLRFLYFSCISCLCHIRSCLCHIRTHSLAYDIALCLPLEHTVQTFEFPHTQLMN